MNARGPHLKRLACIALVAASGILSASQARAQDMSQTPPSPDPRIGLRAGLMDAQEATWNLRVLSKTPPSPQFVGATNSDLAFTGKYAIQGSYNGFQV